jgi:glycogen(starch) synthase
MRILHLAFEDHRRPGSGGGSLRNREINTRLVAGGHEVTVVTANYPGARARTEDGVSYRQCGVARGYAPSLISHQLTLPRVVRAANRTARPDIIVEEFAPLTSSLGVGHWSSTPTVGVAQGFFAEEKARQYHLPRGLLMRVQRWGTRSHDDLIAVSADVAARLRAEAPAARIAVIANGVDSEAADAARAHAAPSGPPTEPYLLFLGRLEIDQKGLDVLLAAMGQVSTGVRLIVAGEGKDRAAVEREVRARNLEARVKLIGAVHGEAKWRLLAGAGVLVLPSRYETFGISPLEAMACGTAVVASDLACLRELVPTSAGTLVPAEDPRALAEAINQLVATPERLAQMGAAGPEVARAYSWEAIADAQLEVYRSVVERNRSWVEV